MKKFVGLLLVLVLGLLSVGTMAGCSVKRDEVLKLYGPGEYMDEELFPVFEQWYKEKTGKTVKVELELFNTLEEMLSKMEIEQPDYDLICPSDYAIERMIKNNWVQPIDRDILKVEEVIRDEYLELSRSYDPELQYSVPFMYGTFGIMYNYEKTGKHVTSWSSIFTDAFKGQVFQKKSMREFYVSGCLYAERDALSAASNGFTDYGETYRNKLNDIYHDTSAAMLAKARAVLEEQKKHLRKYDDEDGKFLMAQNQGAAGLFWSCDAGYVMSEYEDENGDTKEGNPNLWYIIPEEGGNVYIDAYVISSFAKNVDAANYFLQFLCEKESAVANSYYIGAISPVTSAYDELLEEYTAQKQNKEGVFAGKDDDWCEMYMDMLFPSAETLARCAVNPDYTNAKEESAVAQMFADLVNG